MAMDFLREKEIGKEVFETYINEGNIDALVSKYNMKLQMLEKYRRNYHKNYATEEQKKEYRIRILKQNGAQYLELFDTLLKLDEEAALQYLIKMTPLSGYLHQSLVAYEREFWVTKDNLVKIKTIVQNYMDYIKTIAIKKRALFEMKKTATDVVNAALLMLEFSKGDYKDLTEFCMLNNMDLKEYLRCVDVYKKVNNLYDEKIQQIEISKYTELVSKIKRFVYSLVESSKDSQMRQINATDYYRDVNISEYNFLKLVKENCSMDELKIAGVFVENVLSVHRHNLNRGALFINYEKKEQVRRKYMNKK